MSNELDHQPEKAAAPVRIVGTDDPVPVEVVSSTVPAPATVEKAAGLVATPTTTAEQNRHTASQRRVNMVWEYTQSVIALLVTISALYVSVRMSQPTDSGASSLLSNAFFLVIGFYFGRTNHTNVGGVQPPYQGR